MNDSPPTPHDDCVPITHEERTWAMFAHLSSLLIWLGIPFANLIAPFIIWQIKKDDLHFAADQAKECLNFQIIISILSLLSLPLCLILIGFPMLFALMIVNLAYTIIAAIKSNEGQAYRYPWIPRLIP
jgi:uncharacterized Tic20 family protein